MKDLFEKQAEVEKTYAKVLKRFSDINETEVRVVYMPFLEEYAVLSPFDYRYQLGCYAYSHVLNIGELFFVFSDEEKEAVIAHELGHYRRTKNQNLNKIIREISWNNEIGTYVKNGNINENKHRIERLQKWSFLSESYADNEAIKEGYQEELFSALKTAYKKDKGKMPIIAERVLKSRMDNLKRILGGKDET